MAVPELLHPEDLTLIRAKTAELILSAGAVEMQGLKSVCEN
jgi:hypothetical protein